MSTDNYGNYGQMPQQQGGMPNNGGNMMGGGPDMAGQNQNYGQMSNNNQGYNNMNPNQGRGMGFCNFNLLVEYCVKARYRNF